jgi:hypothetical protein
MISPHDVIVPPVHASARPRAGCAPPGLRDEQDVVIRRPSIFWSNTCNENPALMLDNDQWKRKDVQ